jgi:transposase-like protein
MRRLKKRTRVVGIFPSRQSCERLIGSQLLEVHEGWQANPNPYFNMEEAAAAAAAQAEKRRSG